MFSLMFVSFSDIIFSEMQLYQRTDWQNDTGKNIVG